MHHVVQVEIVYVSPGDDVDACIPLFVERLERGQLLLGSWGERRKLPQEPIQLLRGGSAWCDGHL